jgi:signal transduction histidine kinase
VSLAADQAPALRDITDRIETQHERNRVEAELVGGAVHDLNNLLAAIVNYCSLVSEDVAAEVKQLPAEVSARLTSVLSDVNHISLAAEDAAQIAANLVDRLHAILSV